MGPARVYYSVDALRDTPEEQAHIRALRTIVLAIHTIAPDPRRGVRTPSADEQAYLPSRNLVQLHMQTPQWPPDIPSSLPSSNVAWLKGILANGLPAALTAKISLDNTEDDWYSETPAGRETGHVVSHVGFIPIPSIGSAEPSFSFHVHPISLAGYNIVPSSPNMEEHAQRERALWHARRHAFDLRNLSPLRSWGPYLAVFPDGASSEPSWEDDDPDWQEATSTGSEEEVPPEDKLFPDWAWLGAARVVAESTLRAHKSTDDVGRLEAWDNLREGAWLPPRQDDAEVEVYRSNEGGVAGHDWAGVEGLWRYVILCASSEEVSTDTASQAPRLLAGLR